MQRCNPIADFGGTNGKASRQTDAFCFLEYLPGFPNAKKTYQIQMHPIWDDIVLIPYPNIIMELLYLWVHF